MVLCTYYRVLKLKSEPMWVEAHISLIPCWRSELVQDNHVCAMRHALHSLLPPRSSKGRIFFFACLFKYAAFDTISLS